MSTSSLHPKALALALGLVWGGAMVLLAVFAMFTESYGNSMISFLSTVYLGYRPTVTGAVIGGIWGFLDGAIGGYLIAWLYNYFTR